MKNPLLVAVLGLAALGASCASNTASHGSSSASAMEAAFTNATTTVTNNEPASPRKRFDAELGDVEITVDYGSPYAKGRELWGALIPSTQSGAWAPTRPRTSRRAET